MPTTAPPVQLIKLSSKTPSTTPSSTRCSRTSLTARPFKSSTPTAQWPQPSHASQVRIWLLRTPEAASEICGTYAQATRISRRSTAQAQIGYSSVPSSSSSSRKRRFLKGRHHSVPPCLGINSKANGALWCRTRCTYSCTRVSCFSESLHPSFIPSLESQGIFSAVHSLQVFSQDMSHDPEPVHETSNADSSLAAQSCISTSETRRHRPQIRRRRSMISTKRCSFRASTRSVMRRAMCSMLLVS